MKVTPEEETCLPGVPDEAEAPDEAALKKRRATHVSVVADLPSTLIHRSPQGASMARSNMTRQRSRKLNTPVDPKQRPQTAGGAMEMRLWQEAQRRGLALDVDGDGDTDELDRLKQLDVVRQMPVPLAAKRQLRQQLYEKIGEYEESGCGAYCYRRKALAYRNRMRSKKKFREISQYLTLWGGAFSHIGGVQGAGVLTYFSFLKWLFLLNTLIFFVIFMFLVLPQVAFTPQPYNTWVISNTSNPEVAVVDTCSANYTASVVVTGDALQYILNFIEGSGWMEQTAMFYGFYQNRLVSSASNGYGYNIPLAYFGVMFFFIIVSLIAIVRQTTAGFKGRLFNKAMANRRYCNLVFGTNDFSLTNEKTVTLKFKIFYRQVIGVLEETRLLHIQMNRTLSEKVKLWLVRGVINLIIAGALAGAGYLIYYTTVQTVELVSSSAYTSYHVIVKTLIQYMTSLTITVLNAILPTLFKKLVKFEHYATGVEINMNLFRTVFLKLASVAILLVTIYSTITCTPQDTCRVGTGTCTPLRCWETYVGQGIYKLIIMDFLVLLGVTFLVEFPRMLIVTKCSCKLAKKVGRQEFDISKEVLTLIYGETLFWLGAFFAPLIPAVIVIKNFLTFYIKYLTTVVNYGPSTKPYSASDSHAFFMYVLLTSYAVCVFPVAYSVWMLPPSRGCGPFRLYDKMYDIITLTISTFPQWLRDIVTFVQSAAFQIPLVIILCLIIYYCAQISSAYKDMMRLLKEQLVMETHDKRYMMEKIQELSGNPASPPKKALYKDDRSTASNPPHPQHAEEESGTPPGVLLV